MGQHVCLHSQGSLSVGCQFTDGGRLPSIPVNEEQNTNNKNNVSKNSLVLLNPRTGLSNKGKCNCLRIKRNQTETWKLAPPEPKICVSKPPEFCEMSQMRAKIIHLELEQSRYISIEGRTREALGYSSTFAQSLDCYASLKHRPFHMSSRPQ